VSKVEDFDGVKVRVMQNNIFLDTFKTLGTNAVPMAFGEVFTALETKTIDGQENPFVTIETSKFNEVQKYLSVTRHAYTPFLVLYSKKLWDQLSPQKQAVLREAAMEGQKVQRAANRTLNEKSLASLKAKGMQVNEITAPSRSACSTRSSPCMTRTCPPLAPRPSPRSGCAQEGARRLTRSFARQSPGRTLLLESLALVRICSTPGCAASRRTGLAGPLARLDAAARP
jgi:hypothetical protein